MDVIDSARNDTPPSEGQYDNEVLTILNNKAYPPNHDEEGEETYTSLTKIYSHQHNNKREEGERDNELEHGRVYITDNGFLVKNHQPNQSETQVERESSKTQDKRKVGRELEIEALKAKESRNKDQDKLGKERREKHVKKDISHQVTNKRDKNDVVRSKSLDHRATSSGYQNRKKEEKATKETIMDKRQVKPIERVNSKHKEIEHKERRMSPQEHENNENNISNISQINSSSPHSPSLSSSHSLILEGENIENTEKEYTSEMIPNSTKELYYSDDLRLFEMEFDQSTIQFKKSIMKNLSELHQRNWAKITQEAGKETEKALRMAESHETALHGVCSELDALKSSFQHQHAVVMNLAHAYYETKAASRAMVNAWVIWREALAARLVERRLERMALRHYKHHLLRRVLSRWKRETRRERKGAMDVFWQSKLDQIVAEYENELAKLHAQLQAAQQHAQSMVDQKTKLESDMKKAFMRGMCALNLEASTILKVDKYEDPYGMLETSSSGQGDVHIPKQSIHPPQPQPQPQQLQYLPQFDHPSSFQPHATYSSHSSYSPQPQQNFQQPPQPQQTFRQPIVISNPSHSFSQNSRQPSFHATEAPSPPFPSKPLSSKPLSSSTKKPLSSSTPLTSNKSIVITRHKK